MNEPSETLSASSAEGIPCMLMRGGTSKGAYFLAQDLPQDSILRDEVLRRIMGSPDARQIDGIGGAHPLTSKVAIVAPTESPDLVEYLFLQVGIDSVEVSDRQNCGNLLAGVGAFAIERGLVPATGEETRVRIRMRNTGSMATATVQTPGSAVSYMGSYAIDGVPGTSAPVRLDFEDVAGSSTGSLLPTGRKIDIIHGVEVTCIDNGMPSVMLRASDFGLTGTEDPVDLESNQELAQKLFNIRMAAGQLMGLGDVSTTSIPKMVLLSKPRYGGAISTRSFIPTRCHTSIGLFGATTVAAAIRIPGTVGHKIADLPDADPRVRIEHPTGHMDVDVEMGLNGVLPVSSSSAAWRTCRKLFDGRVFPREY